MKNSFGNNITVTLFGESHGEEIGIVMDGLAPGMTVDRDFIDAQLSKRRPVGKISTPRVEADEYRIVSGVFEGKTTGTPLCILIPNTNTKSKDYAATRALARPGHADHTAFAKYHGFEDYRGGGHFSGRITAPIVAAGAIAITALEQKGIYIGSHIAKCAGIEDRPFAGLPAEDPSKQPVPVNARDLLVDIKSLNAKEFAVLREGAQEEMVAAIEAAALDHDSVGGILETAVVGLPAGLGEPWFDSLESILAHAAFSIPAVKGIEFGSGFDLCDLRGSESNDDLYIDPSKDSELEFGVAAADNFIKTATNHNGGINGGITNGMPLVFRTAIKPTPSIAKEQDTVNFMTGENAKLNLVGRHDPCIVHRARVVQDSMVALVLCDLLTGRYGTDYLR